MWKASREIDPITTEEIDDVKRFFPMEKYFILGHARSGTTLLTRLIRLHDQVHCNYQAHFFSNAPLISNLVADQQIGQWMSKKSNRWNHGKDMSTVALRAMMDFIMERDALQYGKTIVGDKSPNVNTNGEAVVEMHKFYPDVKLIYIIRDGRDTLISHRFQNFIDGYKFLPAADLAIRDDFANDSAPYFSGEKSIFTLKAIERMARGWVENVNETHSRGLELYGDQYLVLKYEDLLHQTFETMTRIWKISGCFSR